MTNRTPFHSDPWLTVYQGDCRTVLEQLPDESVHCVVTSPPYWGLRDYGTATWLGGDEDCDHLGVRVNPQRDNSGGLVNNRLDSRGQQSWTDGAALAPFRDVCGKCGATRQDNQLGLEPTPEQYVENMVAVFREVRRVLRNDGTLWLNLGDSYNGSQQTGGLNSISGKGGSQPHGGILKDAPGLKPKDLVGIPWRVAFALQADGWYLRSDIIWAKPNPMPESVTDRPTKSHEYLFLLAKSERYYFDADAVRESHSRDWWNESVGPEYMTAQDGRNDGGKRKGFGDPAGRNIRSVWNIATQPYPGAHFATFPPKLVEPCIKAGTSERGVCPECGAPWRRITSVVRGERDDSTRDPAKRDARMGMAAVPEKGWESERTTTGWQASCKHYTGNGAGSWEDAEPVPATILDPFAGSGTTLMVAQQLSRRGIGIDLSMDYLEQLLERNKQTPLGLSA